MGLGIKTRVKKYVADYRLNRSQRIALGERKTYAFPTGWIRIDWADADYNINLVESPKLPFGDRSKSLIYSAHLIEHLQDDSLVELLGECHRVLRPGGRIRLECPDTEKLVDLYRRRDEHTINHFYKFRKEVLVGELGYPECYLEEHLSVLGEVANYIAPGQPFHIPVYASREQFDEKFDNLGLDDFAQWCFSLLSPEQRKSGGHQNILYFSKLKDRLEQAGFVNVVKVDFGKTTIPELRLNDGPESIVEKPHRRFYSLFVEAARP